MRPPSIFTEIIWQNNYVWVMEFLNQLEPLLRTFWYVAIPASLIFVLQTLMTLIGAGHSDSSDVGLEGHHFGDGTDFQLFSFRNLINFLLGFGWAGISLYSTVGHPVGIVAIALTVGVFFVWLFFFIIKQLQRLTEDNSFQLSDTLNKEAEVYLKIPSKQQGTGKVLVSSRGAMHELEAMTEGDEIPTGAKVIVVAVENNVLIVAPQ